jgi:hypothetical protein
LGNGLIGLLLPINAGQSAGSACKFDQQFSGSPFIRSQEVASASKGVLIADMPFWLPPTDCPALFLVCE